MLDNFVMANVSAFPKTLEALKDLSHSLKCSSCESISRHLCSLAGCGHVFCSSCCEEDLGSTCPICGFPTHVKDIQHNRQLSNMAALCEQLGRVLSTDTVSDSGLEDENADPCDNEAEDQGPVIDMTPCTKNNNKTNPASVYDFISSPAVKNVGAVRSQRRSKAPVNYCESDSSDVNQESMDHNNRTSTSLSSSRKRYTDIKVTSRGSHQIKRSRASDSLVQTTMTQLFGDDPVSPREITGKGRQLVSSTEGSKTPRTRRSAPGKIEKTAAADPRSQAKSLSHTHTKGGKSKKGDNSSFDISQHFGLTNPGTPSSCKKKSADPHMKKNAKGETHLHVFVIKGDVEHVKLLLQEGANPNTRDNAGWTPLHEACNHGFTEIAELLLNNGAMINTPGMENDSPLHDAVCNYRLDCVRLLVTRGASLTTRNIHGHTAPDMAQTDEMRAALHTQQLSTPSNISQILFEDVSQFEPVVILGTSLIRDQRIQLQKCATLLQAKVVDDVTPEVTHIVTSCNDNGYCPRTMKFLRAVLTGKWILTMDWVETCLDYQSRVPEEPFEVVGSTPNPDTLAPAKGRQNYRQQLPPLFDGCKFYFSGSFEYPTPEVATLVQLVRCGGGTILSREPKLQSLDASALTVPYHAISDSPLANCGIYIVVDNGKCSQPIRSERLCSVTVSWLMDCIASFAILQLADIGPDISQS